MTRRPLHETLELLRARMREAAPGERAHVEALLAAGERLAELEASLEEERRRDQALFDRAPDAFVVSDGTGRILRANAAARALLGIEVRAGRLLGGLVHPGDRRVVRSLMGHALVDDREHRVVARFRLAGEERDLELAVQAHGAGNHVLLWSLRDVTDQRDADRARAYAEARLELAGGAEPADVLALSRLAAERDQLRQVLDRLQQGVVSVDRQLRVQVANRAAGRLLGAPLRRGRRLPEPWPGVVSLHELVLGAFVRGAATVREVSPAPDSLLSITAFAGGGGGESAMVVVTDLSERERAERVEREFVANASHELRTPLATIAGAVEILQSGAKDVPAARDRFLRHIEREVDRLARLVNALLSIARAQARHELPDLGPVPVRPLLEEVAGRLEPEPGVEVLVSCPPRLAAVAEADLLLEAVTNLGTNAARHTRAGRIVLGAHAARGVVAIEVRDTGEGVPEEDTAMLFGRFYRGGTRTREGFGLGLAIVREAVNALGGSVELEPADGGGTVARITLPRARVERGAA